MNIPVPTLICILLAIIFPIVIEYVVLIIKKTAGFIDLFRLRSRSRTKIREVTTALGLTTFKIVSIEVEGVANEIASPKPIESGWKLYGDEILFILSDEFTKVSFFWREDYRFQIWEEDDLWYFHDSLSSSRLQIPKRIADNFIDVVSKIYRFTLKRKIERQRIRLVPELSY